MQDQEGQHQEDARAKPGVRTALLRFGTVGIAGTVVNLLVLEVLHQRLGLGFTRSSASATEVAILANYVGNELWTFHHRRLHPKRLVQFHLTALAGAVVTVIVATLLERVVDHRIAQLVGIAAGSGLNFFGGFRWTWRH